MIGSAIARRGELEVLGRLGLIEHPETGKDQPALWATDSSYILWQWEDVLQAVVFGRDVQLG